jgi:uncharacterized protein YndB with AHSA1/START domain
VTVTDVVKDFDDLTLALTAEFDATPERVWQLWADPRQLERWWGPPNYPATMTAHDLRPGGRVEYHLTGPDGDMPQGPWEVLEVDPPRKLVFRDAVVDEDDHPVDQGPSTMTVKIEPVGAGRTQMVIESRFHSREALELALEMDMDQGLAGAIGQIEAILAESPSQVGAARR